MKSAMGFLFRITHGSHVFFMNAEAVKGKLSPLSANMFLELCYTRTLLCHILLPVSKSTLADPKFYLS